MTALQRAYTKGYQQRQRDYEEGLADAKQRIRELEQALDLKEEKIISLIEELVRTGNKLQVLVEGLKGISTTANALSRI